jgi:hypothetical protein
MIPSAVAVRRPAFLILLCVLGGCGLTSSPWKDARAKKAQPSRAVVAPAPTSADGFVALTGRRLSPAASAGSSIPLPTGGGKVAALLDVRDLLTPRTSFAGPRLLLQQGAALDEANGIEAEELVHTPDPTELVATIRAFTGPGPWEGEHAGSIQVTENGFLLLRTDPSTLAAISRFLGQ